MIFLVIRQPPKWPRTAEISHQRISGSPPSASKMYKIISFCTNLKLRNGNFSLLRSSADVCLETVSNTSYVRVSDGQLKTNFAHRIIHLRLFFVRQQYCLEIPNIFNIEKKYKWKSKRKLKTNIQCLYNLQISMNMYDIQRTDL